MLLSSLEYASYLSYSPHGTTKEAIESKKMMYHIKSESIVNADGAKNIHMSEFIAKNISNELDNLPFKDFFGKDVLLVPVPKSSPMVLGALWVPKRTVQAFCKLGLGKEFDCLTRTKPVNKSAFSSPANRPKPQEHYNTISVQKLGNPEDILLVDDVITRGSTLLGCVQIG